MQKIKVMISGVLCLIFVVCCGCGTVGSAFNTSDPTTVVVWHYYNGMQKDTFDRLVNQFNETVGREKGIVVLPESKGNVNELAEAVVESAEEKVGADDLPDIFATYTDTAILLHQKELLVDISKYITEEELEEYVPAFIEEGRLAEDELEVLPVAKSTELLYMNMTDWNEFSKATGAQESAFETWEGLAQIAEQYYNWSGGKAFFGRDAFANYMIVGCRQLGTPVFDVTDNEVTVRLDEEIMRRLWDCYAVPYLKGYYGAYGRFRSDDVKTGDLIACVGSTSSVTYYPAEVTREDGSTYAIEAKVYELPDFAGTEPCAVQQGAGMAVIRSDETRERAAVEFLKWFTDVEQNTAFCVESGYFPVKTAANKQENVEASMAAAGISKDSLNYENLLMSAKVVEESTLYTNKAFPEAMGARNVLTTFMAEKLDAYAGELQALIEEGVPEEEAWESYITEELFQSWFQELRTSLEAVVK